MPKPTSAGGEHPGSGRPQPGVQSLSRSLGLLSLLRAAGGEMGLAELAAAANLKQPTIHRLIRTLVAEGFVYQLPSRRYALGPALIPLGETAGRMLGAWALPALERLVELSGETAKLALLDGSDAVYVAQVESKHPMRYFVDPGRRVTLHCTGIGKALLAAMDDDTAVAIMKRRGMPAFTSNTITSPDRMLEEFERIRKLGYAIDDCERDISVRCVAAVVATPKVLAAISVSAPAARLDARKIEEIGPKIRSIADELQVSFDDGIPMD
jgi:IclR family acetate operon transcriptional repressor